MAFAEFEGRAVSVEDGDTIASALYRAGVRVFSRSMKYHRPRGLYCLSGDCPNCLVSVDGEPSVRACVTPALDGQVIERENAWPSVDRDALSVLWRFRPVLPVGFYYKTFLRPRWGWPRIEPLVRRIAGLGRVPLDLPAADRERYHHHADLFVAGGGIAGLSAALGASEAGQTVVLADEGVPGERLPMGSLREQVERLASALRERDGVTMLERAAAIGVYEGPLVPVVGEDFLHLVHPARVVVATGALEQHRSFPGNDLVGVWLGRGAARLAGAHRLLPGRRAVVVAEAEEGLEIAEILQSRGVELAAVVIPERLARRVPAGVLKITDGEVVAVHGRHRVERVVVESARGTEQVSCDALVLSCGLVPRDGLLRQAAGLPVTGVGDVVLPGCSVEEAAESGRGALGHIASASDSLPPPPRGGFVCLCEDVRAEDLDLAWLEGFRSTELLKRYTTATMGPCQGALCGAHLRALVRARGGEESVSAPTTARPPARPIRVEDAAAGVRHALELRTALHHRHLELGAEMEWTGAWRRPESYGDPLDEYWAVRRDVSIMDVGTLGKFLVAGRDAADFLEQLYPRPVRDLREGEARYSVLLNEAGYVLDDGLICALAPSRYYVTLTSGGAARGEAWLRDWAEWWGHDVHIVNRTDACGAINVTGPRANELLTRLCPELASGDPVRFMRHREIEVAGVSCLAIRLGFVGEPSLELHHSSSESVRLWDALLNAGADFELRPHGLEALRLLRLEKGHIIIGQDTDFDSTPRKLGLDWMVAMEKPTFVGKVALERIDHIPLALKLVPLTFDGDAPLEGANVAAGGQTVGHLTSSRFSPVLGHGVALGWIRRVNGEFPSEVSVEGRRGTVTSGPFYDPDGVRLRA